MSLLYSLGVTNYAQAQEQNQTTISRFKDAMEGDNKKSSDKDSSVKSPEIEDLAKKMDVDYATAEILSNLKNPFAPQFPDAPKPKPVPVVNNEVPVVEPETPIPQFNVAGVVWNTRKPVAIINGTIVSIGDQISNWSVTEITRDGVKVSSDSQSLWVKPIVDPTKSQGAVPGR